jgi:hypothetical protein
MAKLGEIGEFDELGNFIHKYESTALAAIKKMFKQLNTIDINKMAAKELCVKETVFLSQASDEAKDNALECESDGFELEITKLNKDLTT